MKKGISTVRSIVAVFILFGLFYGGAQEDIPLRAPLNPDFVAFLESMERGTFSHFSDDGYPLGYIPPPVPRLVGGDGKMEGTAVSLPATYDLRTLGKVSPVRNQGGCGCCWTFATFASLESTLLPGESRDFSEQHLNATHGFDYAECTGGNSYMSAAYLARWSGPLNETDVPYPYATTAAFSPLKHVQQVVWLPGRTGPTDNSAIKTFVVNHGAVFFGFYWNDANYNAATASYYYPTSHSSNHAVAIVGWDDNYAASNFSPVPPGNGAFLVRNSWGTSWGQGGYFYISYYDANLIEFASFNNAESTSNYQGMYMYDPLGWVRNWGYGVTECWGANIFTATSNDPIKAVGFITNDINTQYTVKIYTGVTAGSPTSGTLAATKTGTNSYPGYYTVVLDSPVAVTSGQRFSIVIRLVNSSYKYPLPTEERNPGYSSAATSNAGESFISHNGTLWTDLYTLGYYGNCCIKAFTGSTAPAAKTQKHAVGDFDGDGADEVAMDFGSSGVWMWNGGAWSQLSPNNPENLVAFDIDGNGDDELAADLGSLGLWMWNGGVWSQLSANNPDYLIAADTNNNGVEELIIDFGTGGLWWRQESGTLYGMSGVDPQGIVALDVDHNGNDEVAADFGTTGMWLWTAAGITWTMLTGADATTMAKVDASGVGNEGIVASLGAFGVWLWGSGGWTQLSGLQADELAAGRMILGGGEEISGDFASTGLWLWGSGAWTQLSGVNAEGIFVADADGNGVEELAVDFGPLGLWLWNSGAWTHLSGVNPEGVLAGQVDGDVAKELVVDFGSLGVWLWNGGAWSQISAVNPD